MKAIRFYAQIIDLKATDYTAGRKELTSIPEIPGLRIIDDLVLDKDETSNDVIERANKGIQQNCY